MTIDELDGLAASLHAGWLAYMQKTGYVFGSTADVVARTHPELRPYAELPPGSHSRERAIASALLDAITALGYRVSHGTDSADGPASLTAQAACAALVEPLSVEVYRTWLALRDRTASEDTPAGLTTQAWLAATSPEHRRQDAAAVTGFLIRVYDLGYSVVQGARDDRAT